jgi:hypothetical protein
MPESNQIVFKHKELATILIKNQNIHEGLWGIFVKFGIGAANIGESPENLLPAAIVPILEIGLQKFDKETNLSVNAAEVNPPKSRETKKKLKAKSSAKSA